MSTRPWTPRTWVVAVASGTIGGASGSLAVTYATRGSWWPLALVGIGCIALLWLACRNDREIRRGLAERREARKNENEEA